MIWIRRWVDGDARPDAWFDAVHVTLAQLDDGRFMSITAGGEIHVWPEDSSDPDWNAWIRVGGEGG